VVLGLLLFDDLQRSATEGEFVIGPKRPKQLLQVPAGHRPTLTVIARREREPAPMTQDEARQGDPERVATARGHQRLS